MMPAAGARKRLFEHDSRTRRDSHRRSVGNASASFEVSSGHEEEAEPHDSVARAPR
jgi:hypothetical protein